MLRLSHGRTLLAAGVRHAQPRRTYRSNWTSARTAVDPQPAEKKRANKNGQHDIHSLAAALREGGEPPRLTFLVGGPGSGKGTLCDLIAAHTPLQHVSVGAILRQITSTGTAEGRQISATMSRGGILPSELSTRLLLQHLRASRHPAWIVDGFPRSFANAVMFDSLGLSPAVVVALESDEQVMMQRLTQRQRRDDVDYIVRERLANFRAEWESIKEFYRRRNLLVQIDAHGSPQDVWKRYLNAVADH